MMYLSLLTILLSCKSMLFDCNTVAWRKFGDSDKKGNVYVKAKGKIYSDGSLTDEKGNLIGKSDAAGIIRNSEGEVVGKREKSLNELRAEYSLPGL